MKDDPTLRESSVVSRQSSRGPDLGFVDPLYMIFFAVVGVGLALISPIAGALLKDQPIMLWHWLCLGGGIAVLAGCVAFVVREHRR